MATCQSFQHNFDKPLQDNQSMLESLSWNQVRPAAKPLPITGLISELKLKENTLSSPPSSFPLYLSTSVARTQRNDFSDGSDNVDAGNSRDSLTSSYTNKNVTFLPMNSERLQLCTEGLGFESSVDVNYEKSDDWHNHEKSVNIMEHLPREVPISSGFKKSKTGVGAFPPPISSIGRNGKPSVSFKSYRAGGRFVLKEIRIPSQEFLHACREDGRLKLHFVRLDDETLDGDEEEENQCECEGDMENSEETDNSKDQYDCSTSYNDSDTKDTENHCGNAERKGCQ